MIKKLTSRIGILQELFGFLRKRRMWWMIPLVVMLVVFSLLLILAAVSPALTPFVYTLF